MHFYNDDLVTIWQGDARRLIPAEGLVVSDPPYNLDYHYASYKDRLSPDEYIDLLRVTLRPPSVVIHYPEPMFELAQALGMLPSKVAAWVYHANTPRQWRMVAWFGITPDFGLERQEYKNPNDRRVRKLKENGSQGPPIYDWWHIEQVKNVAEEKTIHPCQVPLSLMRRILTVTPTPLPIIDPFMGSGTTLRAAKDLGRRAIGIELDGGYCQQAAQRCSQEVLWTAPSAIGA